MHDHCFVPFLSEIDPLTIPEKLNDPFASHTPEICQIAAQELRAYIEKHYMEWGHDFGLVDDRVGKGKMFGVLVVLNHSSELGYLSTFSGKLGDLPHPQVFVPSLFKLESDDYFLSKGMTALTQMGLEIKELNKTSAPDAKQKIHALMIERKKKSVLLQRELFDQYHFLNHSGQYKSLQRIFVETGKNPPSGAGECAAPKLLHYAFERKMKPLALAEFWWGKPTKSNDRAHGHFYMPCRDKCYPILRYMLGM